MPSWKDKLNGDSVPWLLENDKTQPAIRYYTLRDILGRDENDKEVKAAKSGYHDKRTGAGDPGGAASGGILGKATQVHRDDAGSRLHGAVWGGRS